MIYRQEGVKMKLKDWISGIFGLVLFYLIIKYRRGILWFLLILVLFVIICMIFEKPKYKVPEDLYEVDRMDGRTFEYWCADLLRKNGFNKVSVTPGSNDQGIDVLAYKDGLKYGIQCKCYSNDLGNKPVQEATAGRAVYGCDIAVVMTNRRFTKGAVEAAKATGVWLWDRNKLAQMVKDAKGAHEQ